jgi:NDP-sugar pyrophosphorylase family protein
MKAIILSAGQGKRLLPLTSKRPKCLLDIMGKTVLEWQVETLAVPG